MGAYEVTCHLTGQYPAWWKGARFAEPVRVWACGDTATTARDIVQEKLLGPTRALGTGFLPRHVIAATTRKRGSAETIETAWIRHASGGHSTLAIKSYMEGRESFQGTAQHVIWLDEEPPLEIYAECLLRTAKTSDFPGGKLLLTFTPLRGLTPLVDLFLPKGRIPQDGESEEGRWVVIADWDDAPHLSEDEKADLLAGIPPHQREARTRGIPQLGAGIIYPVPESDIAVEDFQLPQWWPRGYTLDVGWNRTAALWGAYDRESGVLYFYSAYKRGEAEPPIHAEAIRVRGRMPGRIDPASRGRSQRDGSQLLALYRQLGLELETAPNALEAGIYEVWQRLSTGRIKVFRRGCAALLDEMRLYRRNEKGQIEKGQDDHLCDDLRYFVLSCIQSKMQWLRAPRPQSEPRRERGRDVFASRPRGGQTKGPTAWMQTVILPLMLCEGWKWL